MVPTLGERIGRGREAEVFEYGAGQVLKLSMDDRAEERVRFEMAAQRAAQDAGLPVPAVGEAVHIDGRTGFSMARVAGLDGLTAVEKKPWRVWAVGRITGQLHRRLAQVTAPDTIPSLIETAAAEIRHSPKIPAAAKARLTLLLDTLPEGDRLCHMDFHPANVMETPSGPVIIDFANARRGDPLADHVKSRLILEVGSPPETSAWQRVLIALGRRAMAFAYRSGYGREDAAGMARWRPIIVAQRLTEGIPEEREPLLRLLSRSLRESERL